MKSLILGCGRLKNIQHKLAKKSGLGNAGRGARVKKDLVIMEGSGAESRTIKKKLTPLKFKM